MSRVRRTKPNRPPKTPVSAVVTVLVLDVGEEAFDLYE